MDEDDVVDWDKIIKEYQEKHPPYRVTDVAVSLEPIPITPIPDKKPIESPPDIPPIDPPVHKFVRKNCLRFKSIQDIEEVSLGNG